MSQIWHYAYSWPRSADRRFHQVAEFPGYGAARRVRRRSRDAVRGGRHAAAARSHQLRMDAGRVLASAPPSACRWRT